MAHVGSSDLDWRQSGKEVARHLLRRCNLERVGYWLRERRGEGVDYLQPGAAIGARFEKIYAEQVWGDPSASASGVGSTMPATSNVRVLLPALLRELKCAKLVDLGCGDLTWMASILDGAGFDYVGCDVAASVVKTNAARYPGVAGREFMTLDACSQPWPEGDVVLCREVLFHLSLADIRRFLERLMGSSHSYFIATTDPSLLFNSDVITGDFRNLNLRRPPFGFGPPLFAMRDDGYTRERILAAWPLAELREAYGKAR